MTSEPRRARLRALAKLNLSLKVLGKRPDGYHELRTIFQTISLADRIDVEYTPGRKTTIELDSALDIPDNLVARAARRVLDATKASGRLWFHLEKRIPMGAGLGGGSSDAAAVLLGLPPLIGKRLALEKLIEIGAELGSDVPFFLLGGAAVALGRGTELYPLPDLARAPVLVVAPDVHVSTAEAYRALDRKLTTGFQSPIINIFQSLAWNAGGRETAEKWAPLSENDFEGVVFEQHPQLKSIKTRLANCGAKPSLLTGSGAALFGVFENRKEVGRALRRFAGERFFVASFVSRGRYRALWRRSLQEHLQDTAWPPQSRYT